MFLSLISVHVLQFVLIEYLFWVKTMVWRNDWGHTSHVHVYTWIDCKHIVPDDVVDAFVLIFLYSMRKNHSQLKRSTTITWAVALSLSKWELSIKGLHHKMLLPCMITPQLM